MSKKCKKERVEEVVTRKCNNTEGMFDNIICLIIVLIVLQFLCSLLAGECEEEEEEECCC